MTKSDVSGAKNVNKFDTKLFDLHYPFNASQIKCWSHSPKVLLIPELLSAVNRKTFADTFFDKTGLLKHALKMKSCV
jgi:hypothetical protein